MDVEWRRLSPQLLNVLQLVPPPRPRVSVDESIEGLIRRGRYEAAVALLRQTHPTQNSSPLQELELLHSIYLQQADPHPALQNSVVLRTVFQFCDINTLASARRVCRNWMECSLPLWRRRTHLTFTTRSGGHQLCYTGTDGASCTLGFNGFFQHYSAPIFQSERIPPMYIRLQEFGLWQLYPIWIHFGQSLTRLNLSDCDFWNLNLLRSLVDLPSLAELTLRNCDFRQATPEVLPLAVRNSRLRSLSIIGTEEYQRTLPISWAELFHHLQQLSSLTITSGRRGDQYRNRRCVTVPEFDRLLTGAQLAREMDPSSVRLAYLTIQSPELSTVHLSAQALAIFIQLGLPIRAIRLNNAGNEEEAAVFTRVLQSYTPHLSSITIVGYSSRALDYIPPITDKLPSMRTLTIRGRFGGNLTYLRLMPWLAKLVILSPFPVPLVLDIFTGEPPLVMHQLRILTLGRRIRATSFPSLAALCPNLVELSLYVNNLTFSLVCSHFPNIRRFCLLGPGVTDVGIMGNGQRPGITALQQLETIKFSSALGEESVTRGFLSIPALRYLVRPSRRGYVHWSEETQLTLYERGIILVGRFFADPSPLFPYMASHPQLESTFSHSV